MIHLTQTFRQTFSALISIIMCTAACADISDHESSNIDQKSFGNSARISYSCVVATVDSYGARWTYQTDEIMNLMSSIKLTVSQDTTSYGALELLKVATDTFSDGNLTVQLVQKGAHKSISVEHKNTSLFARAENGWCSAQETDQYAEYNNDYNANNDSNFDASADTIHHNASGDTDAYDTFNIASSAECENPCRFKIDTNLNIASVVYTADGWTLAESRDSGSSFAVEYTFNTVGTRELLATGYDAYGNSVANASQQLYITSDAGRGNDTSGVTARPNVPYYYQYHNELYRSSSCQNTSIAMVLSYLGAAVHPDQISREFGKDLAQSVGGLNQVFNTLANRYGVRTINSDSSASLASVHEALNRGEPVIVHGFFTGYGHVLVITGYDENGYYVNDPAGTWSQTFKGGYPSAYNESTQGRGIYYERRAFERAIETLDGYTRTTLWIHTLR